MVDFPVTIGIINDAINEATEQVFVVQLQLISSVSQSSVDLAIRPSSLCRIIDNDGWLTKLCDCFSLPNSIPFIAIRIGFERPNYTFTEPLFEEEKFVYLAKENNVTSEQHFRVVVQVTDAVPPGQNIQPATMESDCIISNFGTRVFLFNPAQSRLSIPFTALPDNVPEGTEAFKLSVYPAIGEQLLSPINLTSETFIIIEDSDSK